MKNAVKFISVVITTMLLIGAIGIFPVSALPETRIYVDPPSYEATAINEEFTIDIILADVADLYGWEVKLFWDNSLLECIAEVYPILPSGLHWESPNSLLLGPGIEQEFNATHGRWYHGLSALPMASPYPTSFTGTIKLGTLTFKVIKAATEQTGDLSCALSLFETKLADSAATPIPHTLEHGFYTFPYVPAPPVPGPWLKVNPPYLKATTLGEEKTYNIGINEVDIQHRLVGVEFKVRFDATLLNVVEAVEGTFMKDPAWALNGTQFVGPIIEEDAEGWFVLIGILLLPHEKGNWTAFPEGSGVLASITFSAIYFDPTGQSLKSDIILDDVKMANDQAQKILPQKPAENGVYEAALRVFQGLVDIYTEWSLVYPGNDPDWGGKGENMPSDGFPPQAQVTLFVEVTYKGDVVPGKPVSIMVYDLSGNLVFARTTPTNELGIANMSFRIPQDKSIFGTWTAVAVAEIAENQVEDSVQFEVGYIVNTSLPTIEGVQCKGDSVVLTIEYDSIMLYQSVNATFEFVLYDDLGFPVVKGSVPATVAPSGNPPIEFTITIPKWAFSGTATLYANVFYDLKTYNVETEQFPTVKFYGEEASTTFEIKYCG